MQFGHLAWRRRPAWGMIRFVSHPAGPTTLAALPPSIGDAPVAAVLLRDLAAGLAARPAGRHGAPGTADVEVDDADHFRLTAPTGTAHVAAANTAHAAVSAPELAADAAPDPRTDVYAVACLALTRYLGGSPVAAVTTSKGASSAVRLAAMRQGHRTAPARLGAMPAPFRTVFAQALAKEPHLRPTPAALVGLLDAAFAAVGPDAAAGARARVHRLVVLANAFVPADLAAAEVADDELVREPLHLPSISLPAFSRPSGAARAVLIGAVSVVAVGGVLAVAVLGVGGRNAPVDTPQAVTTQQAVDATTGPPTSLVAQTSAVVVTTPAAPAPAEPAAGADDGDGDDDGNSASARPTPTSSYRPRASSGPPPFTPPPVVVTPPASTPPVSDPPPTTPPPTTPPTDPPTTDPPTTAPPTTAPPTTAPPSSPPPSAVDPSAPATSATPSA